MENVFIKNANVIKKVELTKEILNKLNAGYEESLNINASLGAEAEGLEAEIKEIKSNINALETQKEDLQQLISKGNAGLGVKLIEGTRKVIELKKELELKEETLKEFRQLEENNLTNLINSSFQEFIDSGELVEEFNGNINNLALKLYSHLYQAFETVQEMQKLEKEYTKTCVEIYNYNGIDKDFSGTFNANSSINSVKQNFPTPNSHQNNFNRDNMLPFINGLENAPQNKALKLYK